MKYRGFDVEEVTMNLTGRYPSVKIVTKRLGKPHIVRHIAWSASLQRQLEKEIKFHLDEEIGEMEMFKKDDK